MLAVEVRLPIRVALIEFDRVSVSRDDGAFRSLEACAAAYHARYGSVPTGGVPGVEIARGLFRALGIDPTKRRPSSEALLRRALKDMPLPRVNTLVDVGNWCSLDFLLPLGLYDRDALDGVIVLRRGAAGDGYDAIGDKSLDLEGRYLLADARGPFGSPITDSVRTSVSEATTATAVLLYAPRDGDETALRRQVRLMAARIADACAGDADAAHLAIFTGAG